MKKMNPWQSKLMLNGRKARQILILLAFLILSSAGMAYAQISINLIAVNSADEPRKMPVKFYLPKELTAADIVDKGVFKLEFDVDKSGYYLFAQVDFAAKESKTFKIITKDVWRINQEEVDLLKKQLDESLSLLEKTEVYDAAQIKKEELSQKIDYIFSKQNSYPNDIGRRVEQYRAYVGELEEIRNNIFSLDYLEREAKLVGSDSEFQNKTVKLIIEARNPSDTKDKNITQKHFLPKEIREEHVLDSQGFEIRFDEKNNKAYLSKEELFKAGETKKYTIVLKDIWWLPLNKIDTLKDRAQVAMDELGKSIYADSANYLFAKITEKLDQIKESQKPDTSIKNHIGTFRINEKRLKESEEDIIKLEQMMAIVRAKRLKELEEGRVKNILQRMKALRGLAALSDAIFKKKLSVTMTWRIILGTMGFVALFTGLHFFVWMKRSGTMGEESGPKEGEAVKEVPKPTSEKDEEKG